MQMLIPEIGTSFQLEEDWLFNLYYEWRNESLFAKYSIPFDKNQYGKVARQVCIPKGEVLKVDRIYIRKGKEPWSSVTFYWGSVRFWAKLDDVNKIVFSSSTVKPKVSKHIVVCPDAYFYDRCTRPYEEYNKVLIKILIKTTLRYNIDGKDYDFPNFFHFEDEVEEYKNWLGFKRKRNVFYVKSSWIANITKSSIFSFICKKHGLQKKDCLFRKY